MSTTDKLNTLHCRYADCGHTWVPRTAVPKVCPKCKRYDWQDEPNRDKEK